MKRSWLPINVLNTCLLVPLIRAEINSVQIRHQIGNQHATSDTAHGQTTSRHGRRADIAPAATRRHLGAARRQQEGVQSVVEGRPSQAGHVYPGTN